MRVAAKFLLILLHLGFAGITVTGSAMILLAFKVIPSDLTWPQKVVTGLFGLYLVVGLRWAEHERCRKNGRHWG